MNIIRQKMQKPKILLIEPRHKDMSKGLPLGLAYLGAVLRKAKYNISVLDTNMDELDSEGVVKFIDDRDINIVGIGSTTAQIKESWRILKLLKKKRLDIINVLGGIHPTALPEESLNKSYVDFVLRGECEVSILEFVKAFENKKFDNVKGLSFKKDSKFYHNEKPPLIENLDELPFPARDLFEGFPEKYSGSIQRSKKKADILTSRGCTGGCNFCNKSIHGYKVRARSPENVVNEIEVLNCDFGITDFYILDDYFTADMERVEKICDLILEKELKIKWVCATGIRVDNANIKTFKKMKESGCYRMAFGVESGSEEILRKMGKNINLNQVRNAFKTAQEVGIVTLACFMIGNMWETEDTINQTIKFAKSLKTDYAQFLIVKPYPGTALFKLIENGVCNAKFNLKNWDDYNVFNSKAGFTTNELSEELLLKLQRKANLSFYFRPKQMVFILYKRIKLGMLGISQLLNLVKYYFKETI